MKKYLILAAAALTLAACSNEDGEYRADNNEIRLSASVGEATLTRAGTTIQSTAFATGELINVECTPNKGTLGIIYKAEAVSGTANNLGPNVSTSKHYWPASGTVAINAFYPSNVSSSTESFTVSTDQSTTGSATGTTDAEKGYKGSDLMYATPISGQAKTSDRLSLTFNHALAKIIVNLTKGNGMDDNDINGCTVTLHAKKTAGISNGAVTKTGDNYNATGDAVTITMGTGSSVAAIIVPQNITASTSSKYNFITITTAGNHSVTYQLTANKTFDAGQVYTYNFTVSSTAITLQSTTITDWDGGTGGSNTINGGTLTF